jgi:DNA-binding response OmpR family regulator
VIHVLVIDDDLSICQIMETILTTSGYAVTIATSGRAGLEAARKQPFAAAIVDLCLPNVSGFDAIRALREHAPKMGLIAMSGLMFEDVDIGAPGFLGMGANLEGIPRLAKPFRRRELLDLVEQCCAA